MSENEDEWQLSKSSIMERISYIYSNKLLTDIEIVVGPKGAESQESFHAHKFILIVSSSVFADILQNLSDEKQSQIFFPDISPRGFSNLLKYLYTDNSRFADENEAVETYQAADKCLIRGLMDECQNYASELQLSPENVCNVLEASDLLEVVDLKQRCLKLMEQETAEVLKSSGFLASKMETVESILKLSSVSLASEAELLESVILWGINQIAKGKFQNLRHVIEPFLPNIQFMSMTIEELSRVIKRNENIFNETEILGLFMNIARRGSYELPLWCNTLVSRDLTKPVPPIISVLPQTKILSFNLNCKTGDNNLRTPQSFSITLQNIRESGGILVTGLNLQFAEVATVNSGLRTEIRYEIYSSYSGAKVVEFERQSTLFGQNEEIVKFVIPAELYSDSKVTIQVVIYSVKGLTFPRLNSPMTSSVFPFKYSLDAPHGTFVISKLYYYDP